MTLFDILIIVRLLKASKPGYNAMDTKEGRYQQNRVRSVQIRANNACCGQVGTRRVISQFSTPQQDFVFEP